MKPIYEKLTLPVEEGFAFKTIQTRDFHCPWHFHSEYELILTLNCPGYRLVGDHLAALEPGDLVLVGSNLPHIWQWDGRQHPRGPVHILLAQFEFGFLGDALARMPVFGPVRHLLREAARGLEFRGQTRERATALMREMAPVSGLRRLILFLHLLETLAGTTEAEPIASPDFAADLTPFDQARMNRVFQFIHQGLEQPIRLAEAARVANLSEGAFSRFFRLHAGRTFPEFVNQLRVGRAGRLLAETDHPITEVAFASGFTNLSNFNRQFLRFKRLTPREFRRQVTLVTRAEPVERPP